VDTEYSHRIHGISTVLFSASDEMHNTEFFNVFQIFNHAHAILGSVPFIQVVQPGARKAITAEAVLGFRVQYLLAVLDSTCYTGFNFETIVASASEACFVISGVCDAEATNHSAGSD
jgi:hypothetical protein